MISDLGIFFLLLSRTHLDVPELYQYVLNIVLVLHNELFFFRSNIFRSTDSTTVFFFFLMKNNTKVVECTDIDYYHNRRYYLMLLPGLGTRLIGIFFSNAFKFESL